MSINLLGIAAALVIAGVTVGLIGVIYDIVKERITWRTVGKHVAENINKNNFNTVNVGLTEAKIIDISKSEGETYVAYEINNQRFGLRSSEGTSLEENDKSMLRLRGR